MTSVQILPIPGKRGGVQFHAIAGKQHADAETAGLALDAITRLLPRHETAVVVVQSFVGDEFFSATQSTRLQELMEGQDMRTDRAGLPGWHELVNYQPIPSGVNAVSIVAAVRKRQQQRCHPFRFAARQLARILRLRNKRDQVRVCGRRCRGQFGGSVVPSPERQSETFRMSDSPLDIPTHFFSQQFGRLRTRLP